MLLDHPEISRRIFYPRPTRLEPNLRVDVGGAVLGCYLHRPYPDAGLLLHFHGNGELAAEWSADAADTFLQMGVNVCFAEYRGYGASTGRPTLSGLLEDGEHVFRALGLPPGRVVLFGRSMGSLCAIELARRLPGMAGLVLESGIADVRDVLGLFVPDAEELGVPWEQLEAEADRHLNIRSKLASYPGPVLVLHAANDSLLDRSHAERLHAWGAGKDRKLVLFPYGDHNTILATNAPEYLREVKAFLLRTGVTRPWSAADP